MSSRYTTVDVIEEECLASYNGLRGLLSHRSVVSCRVLLKCLTDLASSLKNIHEDVKKLKQEMNQPDHQQSERIAKLEYKDLNQEEWNLIGSGNFGTVFKTRFKGSWVAIKVLKERANSAFREANLLQVLRHENVIYFHGMGFLSNIPEAICNDLPTEIREMGRCRFLVMEFLKTTLAEYVENSLNPERKMWEETKEGPHKQMVKKSEKSRQPQMMRIQALGPGLPLHQCWTIGHQVASALNYLHSENIAHKDLKPDNILFEGATNKVKVADFGLAWDGSQVNIGSQISGLANTSLFYQNHQWAAPEFLSDSKAPTDLQSFKRGDIYSFSLILLYITTAEKQWGSLGSSPFEFKYKQKFPIDFSEIPENVTKSLRETISHCHRQKPEERPTAEEIVKMYFLCDNPYLKDEAEAEFFSCGFLDKTDIFVADTCITQTDMESDSESPLGYDNESLVCPVETEDAPYETTPDSEDWREQETLYYEYFDIFCAQAEDKEIDNNPAIALKHLQTSRDGKEEKQNLELRYQESSYCHHRAMRKIWMDMSAKMKNLAVQCKTVVHPYFSTSFGLHVAILTDEGPGQTQKFIFCQRSKRPGMSSPGAFTCGAVESCSVLDYVKKDGRIYIDLVKTAARGLKEELGLELTGQDLRAIRLGTIYLKFDTHEWGLCGFVDLSSNEVRPDHRLSARTLQERFTMGPKDKFEHNSITGVDFTLDRMAKFVFENHSNFASSAKLVVVKVLQAFFGVSQVEREFARLKE